MSLKLYTLDEVAADLNKSPRWLTEWLRGHPYDLAGSQLCSRIGGKITFTQEQALGVQIAVTGKSPFDMLADMLNGGNKPAQAPIQQPGLIYFIESGDFIKIGFSRSVEDRLKGISTTCPAKPELLHTEPGTFQTEKLIHRQFAALRVRGEWFRKGDEIFAYIKQRRAMLGLAT